MLDFRLNLPRGAQPHFLFIGAHSDDIEIGCGGTVMELLTAYPRARLSWVVLSSDGADFGKREAEARRSAKLFTRGKGRVEVFVKEFRGSFFPAANRSHGLMSRPVCSSSCFSGRGRRLWRSRMPG